MGKLERIVTPRISAHRPVNEIPSTVQFKRESVDEKSFELAEHFLSDLEGDEATADDKWSLAKAIQDAVETWFVGTHNKPAGEQ